MILGFDLPVAEQMADDLTPQGPTLTLNFPQEAVFGAHKMFEVNWRFRFGSP